MGIWVMSPERDVSNNIGAIPIWNNATANFRFSSSSELKFDISKKYYDENQERWIKNPIFDSVQKDSTLFTDWNNQIFDFPNGDYAQFDVGKTPANHTPINFTVKDSVQTLSSRPNVAGYSLNNNGYVDAADNVAPSLPQENQFVDEAYYLVKNGDILEINTYDGAISSTYYWKILFYTEKTENTIIKTKGVSISSNGTPSGNYITHSNPYYYAVSGLPEEGGYMRTALYRDKNYSVQTGSVNVYSGDVYVNSIKTIFENKREICSQRYWIIKDVTQIDDGISTIKSITALSYDYVFKNKFLTIPDQTVINLYIPDKIKDIIESNYWSWQDDAEFIRTPQRLAVNGILNQIIEIMPNWSVGYINESLLSKYRTFEGNNSYNVYSLLFETIPELYQGLTMLDVDKRIIHIFSKDELIQDSSLMLSYHNAIKSAEISDEDTNIITALHIHTSDDTYGVSLVNPTGNDVIYNFEYYYPQLDTITTYDDNGNAKNLRTSVEDWLSKIDYYMETYRSYGFNLIVQNMQLIKAQAEVDDYFSQYVSIAKIANISKGCNLPEEKVATVAEINNCVAFPKKQELISISHSYYRSSSSLATTRANYNNYFNAMKNINKQCSIAQNFTAEEQRRLSGFVVEGNWSDDNAIFSEKYDARDIYNVLVDLYSHAQGDMNDYISKPNFDVSVDVVSLLNMPEYKRTVDTLRLGQKGFVETSRGKWYKPVLIEVAIDFDNFENSQLIFTTEYKRKPTDIRFKNLFDSLNKISVGSSDFNYYE